MKYLSPACESIRIETEPSFTASTQDVSDMKGLTMDNPAPLSRILPFLVRYKDLEPDILVKLKKGDGEYASNYRETHIEGVYYFFTVQTYKEEEDYYFCFYIQQDDKDGEEKTLFVHYNVYPILEPILLQIRHKADDGHYEYELSKEVLKKMPTMCKLFSNAPKSIRDAQVGLPMFIFLDPERKDTLLSVRFKYDEATSEETIRKIIDSFQKIVDQLMKEVLKTRTLNQSIWRAFRKGLRGGFWIRRLFLLS